MIMRKLWYICFWLSLVACSQEETLDSRINLENLYTIQDDPNDPVKHRIFEIYDTYGIPVYFNDTIGKILLKTDLNGQPVYRYEKLDLAWGFESYEQITYRFEYETEPAEQLKVLDWIESYLKDCDKALYPFSFFVPAGVTTISQNNDDTKKVEEITDPFLIDFRTLTVIRKNCPEEDASTLVEDMKRNMVLQKIKNYEEDLAYFNVVSDENWYSKYWHELNGAAELKDSIPNYWDCNVLDPNYHNTWGWSEEKLEAKRAEARAITGVFGFVMGDKLTGGYSTPYDPNEDLVNYIKVILNSSDELFRKQWGSYPLVIEKYEILYQIITEKLGIKL